MLSFKGNRRLRKQPSMSGAQAANVNGGLRQACAAACWAPDFRKQDSKPEEKATMTPQTRTESEQDHHQALEKKIQQFRELFADAPEVGKKALENALHELKSQTSDLPPPIESAGRVGARLGKVSELTIIVPLAPGGAKRLRAFLRLLGGNLSQGANKVGTLHTMRFVFFDNDTRLLFATAFDGDWDTYIDDFVAKIPDYLDIIDSAWDGWPGIRHPGAKDYLVKHQITAEAGTSAARI
jgi:hypothetical protein